MSAAGVPVSDPDIVISPAEMAGGSLPWERFRVAALLLHTRGYVTLRGAVPADIVEAAAEAFAPILRDCRESPRGEGFYHVALETEAVFWERNERWRIFPRLEGAFASPWLVANPFALQLCRELLGEDCYCKFVSSDTLLPGSVIQAPHRELGIGWSWDPQGYVVNVALGPCRDENGPLEVWPGAGHLWQNALLARLALNADVQDGRNPDIESLAARLPSYRLLLEPGDILIRDPGLLHRGTVNETPEPRTLLTNCYFRRGYSHDYGSVDFNLDREAWEALDPACKSLFAYAFGGAPAAADAAPATPPRRRLRWPRTRTSR
jgi:ectoine hydroxylase-related dioxygenase (phytanoyl-CoA dioxygenase family)